ncbi:hypothetical protein HCU74_08460 [Spongiibacter sp. KMU-166]|uniref:Uncharacterized protein n=1 Tax=Spongiibacter thalassae TaxID=2721624 RepID=A0ABX1GE33_9GAMM|nr:hypothetical protein [Spongiibacter thalassae]NKI17447.1 hypothetical protein [Spongiibacter thalassae]
MAIDISNLSAGLASYGALCWRCVKVVRVAGAGAMVGVNILCFAGGVGGMFFAG